jgi:ribonuclease VapC
LQAFENIIAGDERCLISAVNAHETACILRGRVGHAAVEKFWLLPEYSQIELVPFDYLQVQAAAVAAFDWQGHQSKARLNLSDCAAYALAKTMNAPLLFKGNDFTETDIKPAV